MNQPSTKSDGQSGLKNPWIGSLAALAMVSFAVLLVVRAREPMYQGHPISYWINHACQDAPAGRPGQASSENFRMQVQKIGSPALPYLISKLQTGDRLREWERQLWNKLPAGLQTRIPAPLSGQDIRNGAAATLALFGSEAKCAVPCLIKLLNVKNQDSSQAAETLGAIGPDALAALPALKLAIADTHAADFDLTELAWAVWRIDRETNFVIQLCHERISDYPLGDGVNALNLLGEMGSAAQSTVPELAKLLADRKQPSGMRNNAAHALGKIGVKNDSVVAALLAASADSDELIRGGSSIALWQLDAHQYARIAASNVVNLAVLARSDNFLKFAALNHLDIEPALPALRELVKSDSPKVSKLAEDALKELGASSLKEATNQ